MRKTEIILEPRESQICDLLVGVTSYLRSTKPEVPPVTCRVAGGWVRDKLMGISCHDMDIALDTMMGYDFAQHVHDYVFDQLKQPEILGHHGTITKIKSNPEKSKHLETATARLYGLDVDFVNLRSESYDQATRIPQIKFGSPLEDAQRRDLTINSLFYNLNTKSVEDFLGSGLRDIQDGIIRTPLPPFETFRDDPLRILRCIRFASRFGYKIWHDIPVAVRHPEIRKLFDQNVSKERVGDEITKMFTKQSCVDAARHIVDMGLFDSVLALPEMVVGEKLDQRVCLDVIRRLTDTIDTPFGKRIIQFADPLEKRDWLILNLGCALFPYQNVTYEQARGKKSVASPAAFHVCRESLKLPILECDSISMLHSSVPLLNEMMTKTLTVDTSNILERKKLRLDLGRFLRKIGSLPFGSKYWLIFLYNAASHKTVDLTQHEKLIDTIFELNLQTVHLMNPPLDGKQVVQIASEITGKQIVPGKWVGGVLDELVRAVIEEGEQMSSDEQIEYSRNHLRRIIQSGAYNDQFNIKHY